MCLSQARTWISNVIYRGTFCVQLRWEVFDRFVDIVGIVEHHCLICLLIILKYAIPKDNAIAINNIFCQRHLGRF